ncbi:MAG: hypothetical protein Q8M40_11645 [Legionella sp.]|nr:hypothetical protein [Legionella sp.]
MKERREQNIIQVKDLAEHHLMSWKRNGQKIPCCIEIYHFLYNGIKKGPFQLSNRSCPTST